MGKEETVHGYTVQQRSQSVTGDYWAPEMWLIQAEMCWEAKYTFQLQRLLWKKKKECKHLFNGLFYIDHMLKWENFIYTVLNKTYCFHLFPFFFFLTVATKKFISQRLTPAICTIFFGKCCVKTWPSQMSKVTVYPYNRDP